MTPSVVFESATHLYRPLSGVSTGRLNSLPAEIGSASLVRFSCGRNAQPCRRAALRKRATNRPRAARTPAPRRASATALAWNGARAARAPGTVDDEQPRRGRAGPSAIDGTDDRRPRGGRVRVADTRPRRPAPSADRRDEGRPGCTRRRPRPPRRLARPSDRNRAHTRRAGRDHARCAASAPPGAALIPAAGLSSSCGYRVSRPEGKPWCRFRASPLACRAPEAYAREHRPKEVQMSKRVCLLVSDLILVVPAVLTKAGTAKNATPGP